MTLSGPMGPARCTVSGCFGDLEAREYGVSTPRLEAESPDLGDSLSLCSYCEELVLLELVLQGLLRVA